MYDIIGIAKTEYFLNIGFDRFEKGCYYFFVHWIWRRNYPYWT